MQKLFWALPLVFSTLMASENTLINYKYKKLVDVSNSFTESSDDGLRTKCWNNEIIYEKDYKQLFQSFENLFNVKSLKAEMLIASTIEFKSFSKLKSIEDNVLSGGINYSEKIPSSEEKGLTKFKKEIASFNSSYKKIDKSELNIYDFKPSSGGAKAAGFLVVKGINNKGFREQRNIELNFQISQVGKELKFSKVNVLNVKTTVKTSLPNYIKSQQVLSKTYQRLEAIRRGGYALAVGDYDNDKNQDLLVGSYGALQILKGDGKGGFVEDKSTGLPPLTLVKSAVWADFNNDGFQDLMVVRFVDYTANELSQQYKNEKYKLFETHSFSDKSLYTAVSFYKNDGKGKFSLASEIKDSEMVEKAMPAVVADFNNDGLLDLYVGYPGVKDFTTFSNDAQKKIGKKIQGMFFNNGNFSFAEKNMSGPSNRLFEIFARDNLLYPHSALAADINNNGVMDIVVVDDRGNLSPIYKNNGKGVFTENSQQLGIENHGIGMGVAAADINNDGLVDIALSNIVFDVDNRYDTCTSKKVPQKGLRVFMSGKKANQEILFSELEQTAGIQNPGNGLGGVEFIDYDLDGKVDLYVTNGLWSGSDKSFDLTGVIKRAMDDKFEGILLEEPTHTKSYVMDVLANYKNEKGQSASMGGFQSNRLYKNIGNNNFIDVAYLEGVDSAYDGYIMAKADLNGDGVPDIILRNADPGIASIKNPPVEIFLSSKSVANSLAINLIYTSGNLDGVGTRVKVLAKGVPTQTLIANNGSSQSEKALYFSLGTNKEADLVEVIWPNGKVENISKVKEGRFLIKEGHLKISQGN